MSESPLAPGGHPLRFSLQSLMVATAFAGCAFGWLGCQNEREFLVYVFIVSVLIPVFFWALGRSARAERHAYFDGVSPITRLAPPPLFNVRVYRVATACRAIGVLLFVFGLPIGLLGAAGIGLCFMLRGTEISPDEDALVFCGLLIASGAGAASGGLLLWFSAWLVERTARRK